MASDRVEVVRFEVKISWVGEEGMGEMYLMGCSRLECVTRERRKERNVRSMVLKAYGQQHTRTFFFFFADGREMHVRFVFRGRTSDAILQHLGPVPDVQFSTKEEFPGFFDDTWEGHETHPPPRCNETETRPIAQGRRIDAGLAGEDSRDELGMRLGGTKCDGIVYVDGTVEMRREGILGA